MKIRMTAVYDIDGEIWEEYKADLPNYSDEQIVYAIMDDYSDFEDEFHSHGESLEIIG